jgi:hypothetical protein
VSPVSATMPRTGQPSLPGSVLADMGLGLFCTQAIAAAELHWVEVAKLRERLQQHEAACDKELQVSACACCLTCTRFLSGMDHNCAVALCPEVFGVPVAHSLHDQLGATVALHMQHHRLTALLSTNPVHVFACRL